MILSIDIETYSDLDIKKVGGYKYAENCEVLLFAYAWDDAPVQIVDFTAGETLPDDVLFALTDNMVTKCAYNAQFERTVLSHFLHRMDPTAPFQFLDPAGWSCTMVHALTLGLPGSLDMASKALRLADDKAKMSVGKQLITYFCKPCKPTKINSGRERNLPEHAPEKWVLFKEYCVRDVVAEREIRRRLSNFPVRVEEQLLWELDQCINDRGVSIDAQLVSKAIDFDADFKGRVIAHAKALTGLPNPASGEQLKRWIEQEEGFFPTSITKDNLPELMTQVQKPEVKEMLKLKQLMSKTSVKKYEAMQRARCDDGRVHGLLQFYGANRTGRWCLTPDHEVLTLDGWVRLDNWGGGEIACWNPTTEAISFTRAVPLSFDYDGVVHCVESKRINQISTPDHKMPYFGKSGLWESDTIENLAKHRFTIPITGKRLVDTSADDGSLRVLIMTQADGHYTKEALRFHFKKLRKIERCKNLLRRVGVPFVVQTNSDQTTVISVRRRDMPMWLRTFRNKRLGWWLLNESADIVFDELVHWDGYRSSTNSMQYTSTVKENADVIQALACLSGRTAVMLTKKRPVAEWSTTYVVNIWTNPGKGHDVRIECVSQQHYAGRVYCAETKTGYFLTRRDGKVWITGNSGRLVQVQNLPRNSMTELDDARELLRSGNTYAIEMIYAHPLDVLSQLIRTAFVPRDGCRFMVADFSAIEARVIAWLSFERWRMTVFSTGGDIYCASASKMFGVPVEKHGINSHLRQKGKIAELALGYQGSIGALKAMGADRMGLSDEELLEIVNSWRKASPRIKQLWYDVGAKALEAVRDRKTVTLHHGIVFSYRKGILSVRLPSGRKLAYVRPKIEIDPEFDREGLTYEGSEQTSGKWTRLRTYGGKLVENIVQAIARDCLAVAMTRLEAEGYQIVMHIHDEVVIECPANACDLDNVCRIMGRPIDWAPGLILTADGYITDYYKKD